MCCGKTEIEELIPPKDWWVSVEAGGAVTTFQSEEVALQFLEQREEKLVGHMKELHVALKTRMQEAKEWTSKKN